MAGARWKTEAPFLDDLSRLFRDIAKSAKPWHAIGYLMMPPGWEPDGKGTTTENLRREQQLQRGTRPQQQAVPEMKGELQQA